MPEPGDAEVLHQVSGSTTTWTTANAAENIPGVLTPLGFDFWADATDLGVRGAFHQLGVVPGSAVRSGGTPDERISGVFFGHLAVNLDRIRELMELTPGASADGFARDVFGSEGAEPVRAIAGDGRSGRKRYVHVAVRAPWTVANLPRLVARQTAEIHTWWRWQVSGPHTGPATGRLREAHGRFVRALAVQSLVTMVAQGLFDGLGMLAAGAGRPDFHLRLATGYGGLEEVRMVSELHRIARRPGDPTPAVDAFLDRYGARCDGENELSAKSWREEPERVLRLIEQYRGAGDRGDPLDGHQQGAADRLAAERELLGTLPTGRRVLARVVMATAGRYIPLREKSKHLMAMTMDAGRCAARARGRELVAAGVLADPEDVFMLTMPEVLRPDAAQPDLRPVVAHRAARRAEYADVVLPPQWVGNPEPVLAAAPPVDRRTTEVTGLAASVGTAEGIARVVRSASDCDDLEPDEILVCRATDPSWASAFYLASAAVIDIGGAASHGAIVAREMGLPCVINTRTGTSVIRTGDRLRVDGSQGVVTILHPADAEPQAGR